MDPRHSTTRPATAEVRDAGKRASRPTSRIARMIDVEKATCAFHRYARAIQQGQFLEAADARGELESLGFFGLVWQAGRRLKP